MGCISELLTGGISLGCENNSGGVRKIYITDFVSVTGLTQDSDEVITGISLNSGAVYYDFEFNRNTSSYQETATVSLENGTTFYTQVVTLVIPRREYAKRNKIKLLAAGQKKLSIIVEDSNGLFWLFGEEEGCILSALDGGSGVAKTDLNGYTITLTAEEPDQAKEVDSTIIAGLLV